MNYTFAIIGAIVKYLILNGYNLLFKKELLTFNEVWNPTNRDKFYLDPDNGLLGIAIVMVICFVVIFFRQFVN